MWLRHPILDPHQNDSYDNEPYTTQWPRRKSVRHIVPLQMTSPGSEMDALVKGAVVVGVVVGGHGGVLGSGGRRDDNDNWSL